ncbi:MAG: radical SAM domain-containing [Geobacteraceae bacterium]|nr:MAG: radical SAM domain-containing [Geobacteraceae bacterium]
MNILLISANLERNPYPVFPIGLSYLAGPLAAAGHRLESLDLCFADNPETAIAEALDRFKPGAVVLSIRNIDNVTYPGSRSYLDGVRGAVAACAGRVPVVLGGSGFSLMPVQLLSYLGGDYGVVGEGDEVLPRLLDALAAGESLGPLPGVVTKGSADFIPSRPVEHIGTPDRRLFLVDRYRREGGMANLQTKRGCPFTCIYCTYPILEGNRLRLRPVADIIAEMRELVEVYGVDYIYFVDDIFNYPPAFAEELCRAITAARLKVNWAAFINPGFITPTLIQAMIEAGCDAVEFGTDSGSPFMLKELGKSFGVEDIRASSRLCREAGVDFAHYILFGGPGETEGTVVQSFCLMDEVEPTAVIAMTGIRIYPGTALFRRALEEGVISLEDRLLEPVFYISAGVRETLCTVVTEQALLRKNWVAPGLEINMSDAMLEALRHFPVRGPLWKLMKRLGRSRVKPM